MGRGGVGGSPAEYGRRTRATHRHGRLVEHVEHDVSFGFFPRRMHTNDDHTREHRQVVGIVKGCTLLVFFTSLNQRGVLVCVPMALGPPSPARPVPGTEVLRY